MLNKELHENIGLEKQSILKVVKLTKVLVVKDYV
tara:strand:- start:657 stop:758 length:102 start_codon:yes stop_codon:yes gene_type:complete